MGVLLIFLSVGSFLLYQGTSGVDTGVSVIEGDSVTLNTGVEKRQRDIIMWYYDKTRIAYINGKLRKTCTDVQCKGGEERFRDRLKLDHQTGSLTIMNTRNTDSGDYTLKINSNREKIFSVTVHAVPDSDLSSGAVAGIVVAVLLLVSAAAAVIYCRRRISRNDMGGKEHSFVSVESPINKGDFLTDGGKNRGHLI